MVLGVLFACWVYELYCGGFIIHPCGSAKLYFQNFLPYIFWLGYATRDTWCAIWCSIFCFHNQRPVKKHQVLFQRTHFDIYLLAHLIGMGQQLAEKLFHLPPTLELDAYLGLWWSLPTFSAGHQHHQILKWWETNTVSFQFIGSLLQFVLALPHFTSIFSTWLPALLLQGSASNEKIKGVQSLFTHLPQLHVVNFLPHWM